MCKDPYATAEESASVMSSLPQARKDAINHVNDLLDGRDLMEQGVTAEAYTKGLFEVAADLAENNAALLDALLEAEAALECALDRLKSSKPADYAFHVTSEYKALQVVRAAIAKNKP